MREIKNIREVIGDKIDRINKVYEMKLSITIACDGVQLEIISNDGRKSYFVGTEYECLAFLAGIEFSAKIMDSRQIAQSAAAFANSLKRKGITM